MRKSQLDTPHIKQEVIQRLAVGESQRSIGRDIGIDHSQISRFLRRDDVKPFIEREQMRLLEAVPDAVDNIIGLVVEMKYFPEKDTKRIELAYKASVVVLKSAGIIPSPVQSQIITKIYQQNNLVPPPWLQEMLRKHTESLMWKDEEDRKSKKDKTP